MASLGLVSCRLKITTSEFNRKEKLLENKMSF